MHLSEQNILTALDLVKDPEVPVISIVELGIVRGVTLENEVATVSITPTYSGCPALDVIKSEIVQSLLAAGCRGVDVVTQLSPAWTTDWISESGKSKLKDYGISPPEAANQDATIVPFSSLSKKPPCPRCDSLHTKITSEFGPTACKSLCVCLDCKEPFEYFKSH